MVVRAKTRVRAPHIDAAVGSKMKLIIRGGVGVDNIDVKYAEEKGMAVRNTPCASSASVAELALAHMFACSRYVAISNYTMRQDLWEKKNYAKGTEIAGKTVGIIGFGRIGQELGKMCKALGMTVLVTGRTVKPELEEKYGVKYVTMDELLAQSDFVSLHTPALGDKPFVDAACIAKMKDGAILINTSRGKNVDEAALLDALNSGKLRGAGLDVWFEEPTPNHDLYCHPAVSCTPHIGAQTVEAQKRIGAEVVDIISGFAF
jgi:D-3-phosphoglycerate dehydrogenase